MTQGVGRKADRLLRGLRPGPSAGIEFLLMTLTNDLEHFVRMCAIPHRFSRDIAKILMPRLTEQEFDRRYQALLTLSIVKTEEGALRFHDEVRDHIFSRWLAHDPIGRFRHAHSRLAVYFRKQIQREGEADGVELEQQHIFHLAGSDVEAGFQEFDSHCRRERENLRAENCYSLIRQMREYDAVLSTRHCAWLGYWEALLMADRGQWEDALQRLKPWRAKADDLEELGSHIYLGLGRAHAALQDWTDAISSFASAEALVRKRGEIDTAQLARIYGGMALTYRERGEGARAIELYQRAIEAARSSGNSEVVAVVENGLGVAYQRLGDTSHALNAFNRALSSLPTGARLGRASLYNNIGLTHADRAEWDDSRRFLEQSRDSFNSAGDDAGEAEILSNLMRTYSILGLLDETVQAGRRALKLFVETGRWKSAVTTGRHLVRILERSGNKDKARQERERVTELLVAVGYAEAAKQIDGGPGTDA